MESALGSPLLQRRFRRRPGKQGRRRGCGSSAGMLCGCAPLAACATPSLQESPLDEEIWRYDMTWHYGRRSVTKMSDFDVAIDPTCERLPSSPVDWQQVRKQSAACRAAVDPEADILSIGQFRHAGRDNSACFRALEAANAVVGDALDVDTRYSSWRNDCWLGALAILLCDVACSASAFMSYAAAAAVGKAGSADKGILDWPLKWHKAQLELEGLFFYVELPWSTFMQTGWELPSVFKGVGRRLRKFALGHANRCDDADSPADLELLKHADDNGVLPGHLAEAFVVDHREELMNNHGRTSRCPFSLTASLLSLAIWVLRMGGDIDSSSGGHGGPSPSVLVDFHALQLLKSWEDRTKQFFFDVLTSHWRIWDLLEVLSKLWPPLPDFKGERVCLPGQCLGSSASVAGHALTDQIARGAPSRVLFIGGGESTFQWGSFTVRARQVARGLRAFGIDARSWNGPCTEWCRDVFSMDDWRPTSFVHVKYMCSCAIKGWRSAVHVYDPIDIFHFLEGGIEADAVLTQTSLAKADLEGHPPMRAADNVSVFWLPMHHSNWHNKQIEEPGAKPVEQVGVHTVHHDHVLHSLVPKLLAKAPSHTKPEFVHFDPAVLFHYAGGRVSTPQQTDTLYYQLISLDVGLVKQSGCISEWWFCSRWKTGQRLVNLLSAGVPTIVWGDAQGHLDVVQGLWPPVAGTASRLSYPAQLVIKGDEELPAALDAVLQNVSLRREASKRGMELAAEFSLPRIAQRLSHILGNLERRRGRA